MNEVRRFWSKQEVYEIARAEGIDLRGVAISSIESGPIGLTREMVMEMLRMAVGTPPVVGMEVAEQ